MVIICGYNLGLEVSCITGVSNVPSAPLMLCAAELKDKAPKILKRMDGELVVHYQAWCQIVPPKGSMAESIN